MLGRRKCCINALLAAHIAAHGAARAAAQNRFCVLKACSGALTLRLHKQNFTLLKLLRRHGCAMPRCAAPL